jgi:hypothetical protein
LLQALTLTPHKLGMASLLILPDDVQNLLGEGIVSHQCADSAFVLE